MKEYPRTMIELEKRFTTEKDCLEYLSNIRWPEVAVCPRCKSTKVWLTNRGLHHCSLCGFQSSVISGTVFQDTKKPWEHIRDVYNLLIWIIILMNLRFVLIVEPPLHAGSCFIGSFSKPWLFHLSRLKILKVNS